MRRFADRLDGAQPSTFFARPDYFWRAERPAHAFIFGGIAQPPRDGSEPCLDRLEIYGPDSADNLARADVGARVAASSFHAAHPIDQLAHFNDGKYGKPGAWVSSERGKGWAQVEFPAAVKVARVV